MGGRFSRALTSELDAGMALGSPQLLKQCNAFHALRRQAGATTSTRLETRTRTHARTHANVSTPDGARVRACLQRPT